MTTVDSNLNDSILYMGGEVNDSNLKNAYNSLNLNSPSKIKESEPQFNYQYDLEYKHDDLEEYKTFA